MQPVGFVLFCIGLMIILAAKRIVMGKMKVEEKDQVEMAMLIGGAVIAVRIAGFIVTFMGVMFLML
ncbi:MAG: hypothetical protein ACRCW2_00230 [Cellulosilyticaceae bacterium]